MHRFDNDHVGFEWAVKRRVEDLILDGQRDLDYFDRLNDLLLLNHSSKLSQSRSIIDQFIRTVWSKFQDTLLWRQRVINEDFIRLHQYHLSRAAESNQKPLLLFMVPYDVIMPRFGGSVRIHALARELSRDFHVCILTLASAAQSKNRFYVYPDVEMIVFPLSGKIEKIIRQNEQRFGHLSVLLSLIDAGDEIESLSGFLKRVSSKVAAVISDGPYLYPLIKKYLQSVPFVYEMPNVNEEFLEKQCPPALVREVTSTLRTAERDALENANVVMCLNEKDEQAIRASYGTPPQKFLRIPNGVYVDQAVFSTPSLAARLREDYGVREGIVAFVGSELVHNLEAVRFIVREVAPHVSQQFVVVGLREKQIKDFDASIVLPRNVLFTGKVDERTKSAILSFADIALAPLKMGSGTSLKIPDYLAHGKYVISTDVGARGYDWLKPYICVAELGDFVEKTKTALSDLYRNVDVCDQRAQEARDAVKKTLDWNVVCRDLPARIRSMVRQ